LSHHIDHIKKIFFQNIPSSDEEREFLMEVDDPFGDDHKLPGHIDYFLKTVMELWNGRHSIDVIEVLVNAMHSCRSPLGSFSRRP